MFIKHSCSSVKAKPLESKTANLTRKTCFHCGMRREEDKMPFLMDVNVRKASLC